MDKFKKFVAENLVSSAAKNLGGEARAWLQNNFPPETTAVNWFKKIFSPEIRAELFSDLKNVFSWFSQWLSAVKDFGRHALAWLDRVFPPGARLQKIKRWLMLALLFLIVAVVLLVAVWVCFNCLPFVLRWIVSAVRPIVSAVRWISMRIWAYVRFTCGMPPGSRRRRRMEGEDDEGPREELDDPEEFFCE